MISLDGFETGYVTINENNWLEYIKYIQKTFNVGKNDSIFKVVCGAGKFLYPFYKSGYVVGGLDYSAKLIQFANEYTVRSDIYQDEASQRCEI